MSRSARITLAIGGPLAVLVYQWWWPFAPEVLRWQWTWATTVFMVPFTVAMAVSILRVTHPRRNGGR